MRHGYRTPPANPAQGWYFEVQYGDSMDAISQRTGQPIALIARENALGNPAQLYEGQLLWIPPKARSSSIAVASVARQDGPLPLDPQVAGPRPMRIDGASVMAYDVRKDVPRAPDAARLDLRWPVDPSLCTVNPTRMGVDLVADEGTPICAAASGEVLLSRAVRGNGNTVIIDHDNGYLTVYAHLKKASVKAGQNIAKGQPIGYVGATEAEKPKLHFEVRKGGKAQPVDPMQYLPNL